MFPTENFLPNKHASINGLRSTGTLLGDAYNRKSEWGIEYINTLFPGHRLWRGRHEARLELRIFSYGSITSQNYNIALNVIVSWKVGRGLVEIQHADIIILVLKFSSQLTLGDNIGTNEIHVLSIKNIWFCLVEFNSTYRANKNEIFSLYALDKFGIIRLIKVSSITTYGNERLQRSYQVVLVLK